ncbi:hypothetical protein [Noviherbaspirillum massiliense]|uniref:hypothetical protein n=1 Tax=Noviherbaspirillum massiliense TaxID=1465823 RepID=UPI0002F51E90|nr:hypothetical protein [Noviherbaspirillum massiliense]
MYQASLKITSILFCGLLAACGGGGGDSSAAAASNLSANPASADASTTGSTSTGSTTTGTTTTGSTTTPTTSQTGNAASVSTSGNTNSVTVTQTSNGGNNTTTVQSSDGSGPTTTINFSASVTEAPPDGATVSGVIRIVVRGSAIENVEMLPATGYTPILATFNVSADKTMAWLDFDTRSLPNGTLQVRISAFNRSAGGSGGIEISAMTTRKWLIRNNAPPAPAQIPPASYMPEVLVSFTNLPYVDPQPLIALVQRDDASFDAMLANDWPRVESTMHLYVPANVVLDFPTPLGFYGPWYDCLGTHTRPSCREGMNYMIGFMQNKGA